MIRSTDDIHFIEVELIRIFDASGNRRARILTRVSRSEAPRLLPELLICFDIIEGEVKMIKCSKSCRIRKCRFSRFPT